MLMTVTRGEFREPTLTKRIIIIVGGYGSGKSEVAVNLSQFLAGHKERVAIADLDIVNPYFRSREAAGQLEKLGIESIMPRGGHYYADLPIILPHVKAAIEGYEGRLILDVGGDDAGSRVLSSLTDAVRPEDYDMLLVLNANRPATKDLASCQQVIRRIESASRLRFTGIISNTHMLDETTSETVTAGLELARELSDDTGLPIVFVAGGIEELTRAELGKSEVAALPLDRYLLKPWEIRKTSVNRKE